MEGKGRSRRRRGGREARRRISALLSVALTTAMTLNAPLGALGFGVMEAFASSSDARPATGSDAGSGTSAPDGGHAGPEDLGEGWMTARNAEYVKGQSQDVDIYVIAEDTDVAPGNTSTMRLYLKNNTGSPITDGTLSFTGTRIKKEDGTFTDISGSGVSAEDTTVDDWGTDADMDEDQLDELEALEAEEYAREFGKDGDGQGLNKLTGLHLEPGQLHEIEFEFYTDDSVSAGKAYVDFKFQGEGADGKVRSSEKFYYSIGLPSVEIELLDGQALETGVEHELSIWMAAPSWGDYEIEEVQIPVKGTTAAETEAEAGESTAPTEQGTADVTQDTEAPTGEAGTEPGTEATEAEREPETGATEAEREPETEATGAQAGATEAQTEEETQVAVIIEDEPVPIQAEDSGEELTAGIILNERETVQAPLRRTADVGILETEASAEGTTEETPEAASEEEEPVTTAPTEAPSPTTEPAAPAGQGTGGTQEGTAPTEATEETTAAAADPVDPAIESIPDTAAAVESTAPTETTRDGAAIKASEEAAAKGAEQAAQQVQALAIKESKVSYTVEVFGTEFKRFRPKKTTEIEDIGWISCLYELAEDARPGVYYGKVTAKGKWNKRSFTTSQGFLFEITGEGTITLKGELDGTEVKVSGPASSFPEADKLELVVEALSQEEEEAVQEAIEKKDAPYATFSLSLLANGETADTTGPVTVKVGNRTIKESTAQLTAASEARAAVAAAAQEAATQPQAQAGAEDTYTVADTTDSTADTTDNMTDAITDGAEGAKAPVDTRKGPGADGKGFSGAALTADGTLKAAAEAKAEKETQEPVIADSQEAGLALMRIDTLAVEAEEVKADVTESGDLQTTTNEVMAIYAVTGLDEAHPVFIDSVTLEDGVTVTVAAAEGVLPAGTTLSVEEVTAQVADIVKEDLEAKGKTGVSEVLAYDINLMVDGVKLENEYWNQDDKVKVTFSGKKIEEISQNADTVEIAPIETPVEETTGAKGGVAEVVKLDEVTVDNTHVLEDEIRTVQEAGDGVASEFTIDAEHFTIYVVINNTTRYTLQNVSVNVYQPGTGTKVIDGKRYSNEPEAKTATFTLEKEPTLNDKGQGSTTQTTKNPSPVARVQFNGDSATKFSAVYYSDNGKNYKKVTRFDGTMTRKYDSWWDTNRYDDTYSIRAWVEERTDPVTYNSGSMSRFYWLLEDKEGDPRGFPLYYYTFLPSLGQSMTDAIANADKQIASGEAIADNYWIAMGVGARDTDINPLNYKTVVEKDGSGNVIYDPEHFLTGEADPLAHEPEKYLNEKVHVKDGDQYVTYIYVGSKECEEILNEARGKYPEGTTDEEILKKEKKDGNEKLNDYAGTFDVKWIRTVASLGANAGTAKADNGEKYEVLKPTVSGVATYHRDGVIDLTPFDQVKVTFKVQMPEAGTGEFVNVQSFSIRQNEKSEQDIKVDQNNYPGETIDAPIIKAALEDPKDPDNGLSLYSSNDYIFDGWYTDPEFKNRAGWPSEPMISEDKVYYGRYIPKKVQDISFSLVKEFETSPWLTKKEDMRPVYFLLAKVTGVDTNGKPVLSAVLQDAGLGMDDGTIDFDAKTKTFTVKIPETSRQDIIAGNEIYCLVEEDTAVGYERLTQSFYFRIDWNVQNNKADIVLVKYEDGKWNKVTTDLDGNVYVQEEGKLDQEQIFVKNHPKPSSTVLPDTGGPGLLQFNRFGWLLLLIALMMAGTEVRYFGAQKSRVETEVTEDRWPGSQGPDWM